MFLNHKACAEERPALGQSDSPFGHYEIWTGADVLAHVWLVYGGATAAPFSRDIYSDGLRLRVSGGYGQYSYDGKRQNIQTRFSADTSYAEALTGYLQRFGSLTAKAFVGIATVDHKVSPFDPEPDALRGRETGPKGVIELWYDVTPALWSSLDLSYTTAHDTASARSRTGYRLTSAISLGPEIVYNSNSRDDQLRAGLFGRYTWEGGETSVSAGLASDDMTGDLQAEPEAYGTLNMLIQF